MKSAIFNTKLPFEDIGEEYTLVSLDGKIEIITTFKGFQGEPYSVFVSEEKNITLHDSGFYKLNERILVVDSNTLNNKLR